MNFSHVEDLILQLVIQKVLSYITLQPDGVFLYSQIGVMFYLRDLL